LARRSIYW